MSAAADHRARTRSGPAGGGRAQETLPIGKYTEAPKSDKPLQKRLPRRAADEPIDHCAAAGRNTDLTLSKE